METLEVKLLARVTVNYLFLAQFETFRASLQNLKRRNPDIVIAILQAIIRNVGRLEGISWSRSISSSSHLTWLSLGELLECASHFSKENESILWGLDSDLIKHEIEFLLLLQQLSDVVANEAETLVNNSEGKLWQLAISSLPGYKEDSLSTHLGAQQSASEIFTGVDTRILETVQIDDNNKRQGGNDFNEGRTEATSSNSSDQITSEVIRSWKRDGILFFEGFSDIWRQWLKFDIHTAMLERRVGEEHMHTEADLMYEQVSTSAIEGLVEACKNFKSKLLERKELLRKLSLYRPHLVDALCCNIAKQKQLRIYSESSRCQCVGEGIGSICEHKERFSEHPDEKPSHANASVDTEESLQVESDTAGTGALNGLKERCLEDIFDLATVYQREVQMTHLDAVKEGFGKNGTWASLYHLRFLHDNFGILESLHSLVIHGVIKNIMQGDDDLSSQENVQFMMVGFYEQVIASGSIDLLSLVESAQDQFIKEHAEAYRVSNEQVFPPPLFQLHKHLQGLQREGTTRPAIEAVIVSNCIRELYHHSRSTGVHMLECVMDASLSAIKTFSIQAAVDVLALFPRLQPLVAVMGWDLLAGNTAARRKMMELLWWSSKSAEASVYRKNADEICCIDHLCDQLCYRLELAYFAACINSGLHWDIDNCRLFTFPKGIRHSKTTENGEPADPFVANFVLERLAMHSPVRVLFDVVPDLKVKDALALVKMLPISSPIAKWQRMQDLELLHLHYGIQSAVLALGSLERSTSEGEASGNLGTATIFLQKLQGHLESICNPARRLWLMGIIIALLHMDDVLGQVPLHMVEAKLNLFTDNRTGTAQTDQDRKTAVDFVGYILGILRESMPPPGFELDEKTVRIVSSRGSMNRGGLPGRGGIEAWEWRASIIWKFVDDWEWRLAVLQRFSQSSQRQWQWKEAMVVLRAAPSTLLNLCVQRAQYDLGEQAVHRFALPPEDEATLQLAEWVDGAVAKASVDDAVSRVAEGPSTGNEVFNLSTFHVPLTPLASVLLCVDVAAASARSLDMSKQLLNQARSLLTEMTTGSLHRQGLIHLEQVQEACIMLVTKRLLQCLQDLAEQDKHKPLQTLLSGLDMVHTGFDTSRQGSRHRALAILQQTIEDAHNGKRQFLSGKLHNLVKALADDEAEESSIRISSLHSERKALHANDNGLILGCGFRTSLKSASNMSSASGSSDHSGDTTFYPLKGTGKRFLGPLSTKSSAYLSAFILYIATIGDIVDGVDTTHDFNFFSLVYERPNDLLTRLVFERGSADAAGKIAEIMGADMVHQVISACVPPVYPPKSTGGWACIPCISSQFTQSFESQPDANFPSIPGMANMVVLYPLKLDVIKHMATISPVRAVLACVFGTSNFRKNNRKANTSLAVQSSSMVQEMEADQSFYDFALDQSDRFPTLNRWIQMQVNLLRLSDIPMSTKKVNELDSLKDAGRRAHLKRGRELESDTESEDDETIFGVPQAYSLPLKRDMVHMQSTESIFEGVLEADNLQMNNSHALLFDWENEGPYKEAVERLIDEGKLVDALALADRYLRTGAPDELLQLLIERGDDRGPQSGQWQGYATHHNPWNVNWQYCIRLRNKQLAATLALKYLKNWDLESAINVLTMCSCHLPLNEPLCIEVLQVKQALQLYSRILRSDGRFSNWQEVENLCQKDPEGLALRLAGKGAVQAALEVAETFGLQDELRRELQGHQLVKLLTSDPISGGGPAEAFRFLVSLHHPEDALPIAMAAMEQLPTLKSKQLLVHFLVRRCIGMLSEEELPRLHKLELGLQMLGALPLPWQQRCSALHEHPRLILETLLMWKQLQAASQLLQSFPSLRDDELILVYAAKSILVGSHSYYEWRSSLPSMSGKPAFSVVPSSRTNLSSGIMSIQREARRAFSWTSRDSGNKIVPKETSRKRKGTALPSSQKAVWEAMAGSHDEREPGLSQDGFERFASVAMAEGWVLTGDLGKDDAVRSSHRYEGAPCVTLFKALLALCSSEVVAAKAAVRLTISEMKRVLNSQQLPPHASSETIERAFHACEIFVQALLHARTQLKKLLGGSEFCQSLEERDNESEDGLSDLGNFESKSSSMLELQPDSLSSLLLQADTGLNHAELLQSLLGAGIVAALDDIGDKESAEHLCDRLINEERYSMAVYACTKCKIHAFPVWKAWAHALVQMEHYAQARVKLKQALRLYNGDPALIVRDIISTMEASPPVDISSVRSLYIHMAKSASTILDDSLSADSYLNVLYMPSSLTKSERSRRSSEDSADNFAAFSAQANGEDGPRSNLDSARYEECVYYLQEYARQDLLSFMFRHGHYADACLLFFPAKAVPPPGLMSSYSAQTPTSSPQRPDPLATDYGSIDDLCELCVTYGAMPVLERVVATRGLSSNYQDPLISQHTAAALSRVCSYCENHKHFNHLYRFQVLRKDHVAAGLCCIQLFLNSSNQEQALRHLERAKMHFDEGLSARQQASDLPKSSAKAARGKSPSERFSEEELAKFSTRIAIQMDVVRCFSDAEGFPWKQSLFGNPNEADTLKRRAEVAESLAERNFDLAFQIIYEFGLPAIHIYAAVAASLAERKKNNQLADLLKNIKATISDDDLDQVITAAIMVFANKHRERPDRLIEMLSSSHRKVLACVVCGRLKSAFQIASQSGNVADVQYVAHQAQQTSALAVKDMCRQWLSRHL